MESLAPDEKKLILNEDETSFLLFLSRGNKTSILDIFGETSPLRGKILTRSKKLPKHGLHVCEIQLFPEEILPKETFSSKELANSEAEENSIDDEVVPLPA